MMKSKSRANLENYGTDEHICGIGMAARENEQALVAVKRVSKAEKVLLNAQKKLPE